MEALIAREVEAKPSNQADDDSADDPDDDPDDGGADVLAPVG
jgi:hypothetical protein